MHVALVCDSMTLNEAPAAMGNLVVGLMNEQISILQVIPECASKRASDFGKQTRYHQSKWNRLNNWRIASLAGRNGSSGKLANMEIDIVHALSAKVWTGTAALAKKLDAAAAFSITSKQDLDHLKKLSRSIDLSRSAFLPATEPLAEAAKQQINDEAHITTLPPGAHINDLNNRQRHGNDPIAAVISGNGIYDENYQNLLISLATIANKYPGSQFFLKSTGHDQYRIWRTAEQMNLLNCLSLIPHDLEQNKILLHADLLIHPQPLGQIQSITTAAMAHGLPIIAHQDPWLDYLIDGQTALVLDAPDSGDWTQAITKLADNLEQTTRLKQNARKWIEDNRLASSIIAQITNIYRRLTGESIPFPQQK